MMATRLFGLGLLLFALDLPSARAQVTLDVAKITCEQYVLFKVADPKDIAIWLSGYFSGKRDSTVIDTQGFEKNVDKLRNYCHRNMQTPIIQAAEAALSAKD